MKTSILVFALILSSVANAGIVTLPLGGKIALSSKDWNVQETKAITGVNALAFFHREKKDLQGILLDGTVKEKGDCAPEKTVICERIVPMGDKLSYQIVAQRFIGKNTYQNYVLAFTLNKNQEEKLLPVLKKLKSQMEFSK